MGVALALGVALSRTPPPQPVDELPMTVVRELIGFPIPPEPTVLRLLTQTYPDALFVLGCLGAVLLYLGGVWRLRVRGDRWPVGRTIAWLLGVGTIALDAAHGFMTYGMTMLSVHMGQHPVLMMVSPVLLVLGGPVTLALRAIRPARRGGTGPREWLLAATQSRAAHPDPPARRPRDLRVRTFVTYFTGFFEYAMRNHTAHQLMSVHRAGGLSVLRGDHRHRPAAEAALYVARVGLQFAAIVVHAFFGLALMESARLIAGDYYRSSHPRSRGCRNRWPTRCWPASCRGDSVRYRGYWCSAPCSSSGTARRARGAALRPPRRRRRGRAHGVQRLSGPPRRPPAGAAPTDHAGGDIRGLMTGRLDSSRFYRGQVVQSEERPPEKRKVGGSIPPLSTTCRNVRHGLPTQVHLHDHAR